jgi:hypothetical protein
MANKAWRRNEDGRARTQGGFMGSSWSGFVPQNDIIKLQWAVLEGCQTDVAAKALSDLLGKAPADSTTQNTEEQEDGSWASAELGLREIKIK